MICSEKGCRNALGMGRQSRKLPTLCRRWSGAITALLSAWNERSAILPAVLPDPIVLSTRSRLWKDGARSPRECGKPERIFEIVSPSRNLTRCAPLTYRARGLEAGAVLDQWKNPGHELRMRVTWSGAQPLLLAASAPPAVHVSGTWWGGNSL